MMTARIVLKKNEDKRIRRGHLWIFSNEISTSEGVKINGDLADFFSHSGEFLGSGFYNPHSLIAGRILSTSRITDIKELLSGILQKAWSLRMDLFPKRNSFRFVHSESDFLPGLIIDKYNRTFVLQCNAAGMQLLLPVITTLLHEEYDAENILTATDERLLQLEGMGAIPQVLTGQSVIENITDGIAKFAVDFGKTQKTGFFFDQVENRKIAATLANGAKILDAFCNSGGFGIHALLQGADHVDFVDTSELELQNVKTNLLLNGLDDENRYKCTEFDCFDFMEQQIEKGIMYDIVMVDPPTFAKNRKSIPVAIKAYQKLHRLSMALLKPNGYLVTSSCSQHVSRGDFIESVVNPALKLGKKIQLIHSAGANSDHPVMPTMPETEYLKFLIFKVS